MIEINWTLISYCIIGLFALSGFFRGWWKEAITTFFLGILVFLLRTPEAAQWVIDQINNVLSFFWGLFPLSMQEFIVNNLGIGTIEGGVQIDASSGQTWLVILIILLAFSIILSRLLLPNQIRSARYYNAYVVTPLGSFLGGLLGGLNGFLIINLVREYLDGRNLPPSPTGPATETVVLGGETVGIASSGVGFSLTDLPAFTGFNNLVAWIVVGFGLLLLLLVLRNRVMMERLRVSAAKRPAGYKKLVISSQEEI